MFLVTQRLDGGGRLSFIVHAKEFRFSSVNNKGVIKFLPPSLLSFHFRRSILV
jgi:hypothetical protein